MIRLLGSIMENLKVMVMVMVMMMWNSDHSNDGDGDDGDGDGVGVRGVGGRASLRRQSEKTRTPRRM